jgi:hypothetical protein
MPVLLGEVLEGLPRNKPQKTPLKRAGFYFNKNIVVPVWDGLAVMIPLAAKWARLHRRGAAF